MRIGGVLLVPEIPLRLRLPGGRLPLPRAQVYEYKYATGKASSLNLKLNLICVVCYSKVIGFIKAELSLEN